MWFCNACVNMPVYVSFICEISRMDVHVHASIRHDKIMGLQNGFEGSKVWVTVCQKNTLNLFVLIKVIYIHELPRLQVIATGTYFEPFINFACKVYCLSIVSYHPCM